MNGDGLVISESYTGDLTGYEKVEIFGDLKAEKIEGIGELIVHGSIDSYYLEAGSVKADGYISVENTEIEGDISTNSYLEITESASAQNVSVGGELYGSTADKISVKSLDVGVSAEVNNLCVKDSIKVDLDFRGNYVEAGTTVYVGRDGDVDTLEAETLEVGGSLTGRYVEVKQPVKIGDFTEVHTLKAPEATIEDYAEIHILKAEKATVKNYLQIHESLNVDTLIVEGNFYGETAINQANTVNVKGSIQGSFSPRDE